MGRLSSPVIEQLNERFDTEFRRGDQLFFDTIREDAVADTSSRQAALANTQEKFGYVFLKALEGLFIDRMEMNEPELQHHVGQNLMQQVYDQIRTEAAG